MKNPTYYLEIWENILKINDLTQKEKNFINEYYDDLKIDFEENLSITIETNPEELGYFLIHSIRRFLKKE